MELSKFLQQDIMEFLEKKSSEQREHRGRLRSEEFGLFSIEKDYAKETDQALEEQDYTKAKRIFDELREAYNGLRGDNEKREKIYAILEEVYAKIKEGLKGKESLEDDLAGFEEGMRALQEKDPKARTFDKEATKAEQEREASEKKLKGIVEQIGKDIDNDDDKSAVAHYNELKEAFQHYPSTDKYRKIDWYNQVLGTYEQIKRLQQHAKGKDDKQAQEEERKRQEEEERRRQDEERKRQEAARQELKGQQLKQAKKEVREVIESLDKGDLKRTTSLLLDARHQVAKLDKDLSKEKNALEGILSTVTHRIEFLKREEQQRKQEEQRPAPTQEKPEEEKTKEKQRHEERARQEKTIDESQNAEELYRKGLRYQHEGKNDQAEACYEAILKIAPNHLPAQIRLEQLQERGGQHHANDAA